MLIHFILFQFDYKKIKNINFVFNFIFFYFMKFYTKGYNIDPQRFFHAPLPFYIFLPVCMNIDKYFHVKYFQFPMVKFTKLLYLVFFSSLGLLEIFFSLSSNLKMSFFGFFDIFFSFPAC